MGFPGHRKHPEGAAAGGSTWWAPPGPGLVDRRPVRYRITAVHPGRGSRVRQCGRRPVGRRDLLHRFPVLHRGRVPDLPGSRGCSAARAKPRAPAVLRLPAGADRLVGHSRAIRRDPVLQCRHRKRGAVRPVCSGRAPARVAARCRRLRLLSGGQRAGLVRGLPRLGRLASPVLVIVDHLANLLGSVAFGVSAVAGYINPDTGQLLNAQRSNLGTFIGAVCFFAGSLLLLPERTEDSSPAVTAPAASATGNFPGR